LFQEVTEHFMKTVIRTFENYMAALNAANEIERMGVEADNISIVADNRDRWFDGDARKIKANDRNRAGEGLATGVATGGVLGAGAGLLAGLGLLVIPGLGPVVAGGRLASTAVGAAAGAVAGGAAGGIIGALVDAGVPENEANVYTESVRRGGAILIARRLPAKMIVPVEDAMRRAGGVDAGVRGKEYRDAGWTTFDPNWEPGNTDQQRRPDDRF
jgi:hypothetical protein